MALTVIDTDFADGMTGDFVDGVDSGLTMKDGTKIYLYHYGGANVPDLLRARIVFGRKADAYGDPDPAGTVVFAACVKKTDRRVLADAAQGGGLGPLCEG